MAEAFSNKLARAVGVVNSSTGGSIGITTNLITGISTGGVTVADLVDTGNYLAGTKVSLINRGETQRIRLAAEPALSFVPDPRAPPKGCCPTTAPVGLSFM